MRLQDYLVRTTQAALEDVIRAAEAVPPDQADWSPGGHARSVLNQMQEIALSGAFFTPLLRGEPLPAMDDHARRETVRLRRSYNTVAKCAEAARASTAVFLQAVSEVPDERLDDEVWLPLGGGMTLTLAEVMGKHHWNLTYHLGQINLIQLALGDRQMH